MAHNLYKERFVSYRVPAWHRIGKIVDTELTAVEALDEVGGYRVEKHDLYATINIPIQSESGFSEFQQKLKADKKGLVAHFDDGDREFLGVCDNRYEILQPKDITTVWDMTTSHRIETMGILSKGKSLFFSAKLPSYAVRGDEVENYLLVHSPMIPGRAATISITPVRVVCQNTLSHGLSVAREQFRVIHTKQALNRFGTMLQTMWENTVVKQQAVKEAMEVLANSYVKKGDEEKYVEQVFPYPETHSLIEAEAAQERINEKRNTVLRLFEGGAKGADTDAFKGTYFGLYNSVVEFIDYYSRMRSESVVFGNGSVTKQRAFELAMAAK